MKHRIRKLTSLLLSLSLISALTLPAAASNALGEDLSAKDTLLHQETQLSTNVFWSTTYSDLRTENLITYTPNKAVTPIVTYGDALTDRSSVADMACPLTYCWYTSPLRPLGRNRNSLRHRRKQVSLQPARPRRSHGATASGRQIVVVSVKIGASIFSLAAS